MIAANENKEVEENNLDGDFRDDDDIDIKPEDFSWK